MAKPAKPIKTVAFVSLGCPKNLVDSERMLGLLASDGLSITNDPTQADAIIINTCGFLEAAKEESLREIQQAVELKQTGRCQRIVVAGCLVQRHKTKLLAQAPGIDRLVGVFDRQHIVQAVRGQSNPHQAHGHFLGKYHNLSSKLASEKGLTSESATGPSGHRLRLPVFEDDRARLRLTPRHYAYLRISEGCNQGCAFCTIPSIRGPMRSKPIDQILAEARELAADGAVELNLIGQDTTSYGTDIGYQPGLSGLLATLDTQLDPDVRWLRLMYAYPSCFTDDMISAIADAARVVKYIDIPLQHINDQILQRMRRRVTGKQTRTLLDKLRQRIPNIAIRTTFITGAPGETPSQHRQLVRFVADFGFDMMGVFPYSQEPGTPMGRLEDQIPDQVKQERLQELMLTQQKVAFTKAAAMKGKTIEVLVDQVTGEQTSARGQSQAPQIDSVTLLDAPSLHPGQMLDVTIYDNRGYDTLARPARRRTSLPVL